MAKTAEELRIGVRRALGNPSTDSVPDGQIDDAVDFSYKEVLTRYRHPEIESTATFTTVAGTITESLPSDYWYTQVMKDEDNIRRLLYRRVNWIIERDSTVQGQPTHYTRHGSVWRLWPTPGGAYDFTVYYVTRPSALQGTGSTIFDGIEWDEIVKWGAVWRLFQELGEQDRMIHTRNIWRTLVGSMPELDVLEGERSPEITRPLDIREIENEF